MENPFSVFPEELWLIIVKNYEVSSLQNLLLVFPQLLTLFSKKLETLQFTRQSSTVFKVKRSSTKFSFYKLISNDWCNAVENFVKSVPLQYLSEENQVKLDFNFLSSLQETFKTIKFGYHEFITSSNYNGDVKAVSFYFDYTSGTKDFFEAYVEFCKEYGNTLKTVTMDIHHMEFGCAGPHRADINLLVECLQNMKNVHTLSVNFYKINYQIHRWRNKFDDNWYFPKLPHLHTLEFRENFQRLGTPEWNKVWEYFHLGWIGNGQVKIVRIVERKQQFIIVEENELGKWNPTFEEGSDLRKFKKLHKLKRVKIKPTAKRVFVIAVLWWLLKEDKFAREVLFENTCKTAATVSYELILNVPFITYFKITDATFLEYRFLSSLTSLEHLHVVCDRKEHVNMFVYKITDDRLTNIVRRYLYDDTVGPQVDIWSELPILKTFVVIEKNGMCRHFVRDLGNRPLIFTR